MLQPYQNTGVIEELPRGADYVADIVSGIDYKIVNPSGDWTDYLPADEAQLGVYGDTLACVTFSALNCLETLLRNSNNLVNFSDRFTAKMSGTTRAGNYLTNVADSIRKDGLVLEADWSWDRRGNNPAFDWDEFYKDIPQNVKDLGVDFTKKYSTRYEWVATDIESLKKHLKQAPLQIVTKVCGGWNNPPVAGCGFGTGHATMLYKIDDEGYHIFDHYEPYRKVLKLDYVIAYAMKHIINPKQEKKPMLPKIGNNVLVQLIEGGGGFGLHIDGKMYVDKTDLLLASFIVRNGGKTEGKTATLRLADWANFPKYNLKNEPI